MLLYATTGGQWVYPVRVTYSFAPDGTSIGGTPSSLFQKMASEGISQANWQLQFEKAFALWEGTTKLNLARVSDDGSAYGFNGNQQGAPNVGDIRIAGAPLASNVLAEAFYGPAINGGSLAGDIVFNTNQTWNINSNYDIETVALHEIGHALGLAESSVSTADMYGTYTAIKETLTSDDSSGMQTVYGPAPAPASNATASTALDVMPNLNGTGQLTLPSRDIASAANSNWYYVTAPAGTSGTMTVTMQSSNLSSLSPKLVIENSAEQGLATASAANSFGGTVTVQISGVSAGQGFYIRAMAANSGAGSSGAYALQVNFGNGTMAPVSPSNTAVAAQPDQGGGAGYQNTGGSGGLLGGLLGGLVGLVDSLLEITIGDLTGYGDPLTVKPQARVAREHGHRHGHRHSPVSRHRSGRGVPTMKTVHVQLHAGRV
jgi:hypothetical protein